MDLGPSPIAHLHIAYAAGKQPEISPDPKESEAEGSFKPAKETKKIPLDPVKEICPRGNNKVIIYFLIS